MEILWRPSIAAMKLKCNGFTILVTLQTGETRWRKLYRENFNF